MIGGGKPVGGGGHNFFTRISVGALKSNKLFSFTDHVIYYFLLFFLISSSNYKRTFSKLQYTSTNIFSLVD